MLLVLPFAWLPLGLQASRVSMRDYDRNILQTFQNTSEKLFTTKLSSFPEIGDHFELLSTPSKERDELILDSFKRPASRKEALEIVLKEMVLHQRFSEEKMKLIADLAKDPNSHAETMKRLQIIGFQTWKLYADSKTEYLWCNILLRWTAYCFEHPDDEPVYQALFSVLQECAFCNWFGSRSGLQKYADALGPFTEAESLFIYTTRSRIINENIFVNTWFKDTMTLCAFHYTKMVHLLVWADGLQEGYAERVVKEKAISQDYSWPPEFIALNDRLYGRLTYKFYSEGKRNMTYLTPAVIDDAFDMTVTNPDLLVASDITSSGCSLFEQSYIFTRHHVAVAKPKGKIAHGRQKRVQRPKATGKTKRKTPSPTQPTILPVEVVDVAPEEPVEIDKIIDVEADEEDVVEISDENVDKEEVKGESSSDPSGSNSNEDSGELSAELEDGEAYWKAQQEEYQLRKQLIQQQAKENTATHRLQLLSPSTPNKNNNNNQKQVVAAFTSTDFCAAFPSAHELFIRNGPSICQSGAKRYRWVFDERVQIKEEHMEFLCRLFGLSNEGKLSYRKMCRTFHQLEGPVAGQRNGFFQFSHRFEINREQTVLPVADVKQKAPTSQTKEMLVTKGKSVHREHKSSRFNWKRARELFEGAGFDPRFFLPTD